MAVWAGASLAVVVPWVLLRRDVSGEGLASPLLGVRSSMAVRWMLVETQRKRAGRLSAARPCFGQWKLRMAPAQALCLCARVTLACRRAMPAIKEGTRGMSVFAVPASAEVWCGRKLQADDQPSCASGRLTHSAPHHYTR